VVLRVLTYVSDLPIGRFKRHHVTCAEIDEITSKEVTRGVNSRATRIE